MRVLVHAPPLTGHTLPLLPLAHALRGQGHELAWAAGADTRPLLQAQGFECMAAGPDRAWASTELHRLWPDRAALAPEQVVAELGPRLFADVYAPATLPDLIDVVDRWRPDLLLHDVMAHAAPLAAALRGLRSVSHGFGLPRPRVSIDGVQARMAEQWQAWGLELPPDGGNHRGGHVDICPPSLRGAEPLPPGLRWSMSPASGVQRRAGPRHGVVASFGTVHNRRSTFDELLQVLCRGRWPAQVALGRPVDPAVAWPAHVQVSPWMDLPEAWRHCRVAASHGGAGTALGALAQGVPQLLLPVAADQFRNAAALVAAGTAIALQGDAQTGPAMHQALKRLHDEPAFTHAAERMADEIAAMPQAEAVARALTH